MKKIFTFILALVAGVGTIFATQGALSGKFTINADGDQIVFSQGNLQYVGTWQFATNQWDTIGAAQADNNRDLFGWGTGNNPNNVSMNSSDYATYTEWGNNPITNGGNKANQWRTLSKDEWVYLFYGRTNAATLFGLGSVNGLNGTILLPDNWTLPSGLSFTASTSTGLVWTDDSYYYDSNGGHFGDNTYTTEQWATMEAAGAVFLPAAGYRYGTGVRYVGSYGYYWSSTPYDENYAYDLYFDSDYLDPQSYGHRSGGQSVRLVQDYVAPALLTVAQAMETYNSLNLEAGAKSTETYTIRGYVTKWKSGYPQYQNADFFIDDTETGSQVLLEAYRLNADNDADKRTLIVGDFIEATAYFKNNSGNAQLVDGTFHVVTPGTPPEDKGNSSIADFISTADTKNIYHLTGTVSGLPEDKTNNAWKYGNFNLTDATGTIYIYGLLTADSVAQQFSTLDIENEDEVTLKGVYTTNNGTPQIANAIFISRTKHQDPSGLEQIEQSPMRNGKFIRDGQLFIQQGDKLFNAQGARVE